ncbi:hypothetical protein [Shewanella sp.]|uniref:hypothetical protein n=1 Tax=Shewanella sp. TaxID=50422 RepID=UPI003A97F6F7
MTHCSMQRCSFALFMLTMLSACSSQYTNAPCSSGPACAAFTTAAGVIDVLTDDSHSSNAEGCAKLTGTKQQECMTQAKALSESIDNRRKQL